MNRKVVASRIGFYGKKTKWLSMLLVLMLLLSTTTPMVAMAVTTSEEIIETGTPPVPEDAVEGEGTAVPPTEGDTVPEGVVEGEDTAVPPTEGDMAPEDAVEGEGTSVPPTEGDTAPEDAVEGEGTAVPPAEGDTAPEDAMEGEGTAVSPADTAVTAEPVDAVEAVNLIPDPWLQAGINEELGRAADAPLTQDVLEQLTYLELSGREENHTQSLEGMQYAVNLESIFLYGDVPSEDVMDLRHGALAPLAELKNVRVLCLYDIDLNTADLAYFSGYYNLEVFAITGANVNDLNALQGVFERRLAEYRAYTSGEREEPPIFYVDVTTLPLVDISGLRPYLEYLTLKNNSTVEYEIANDSSLNDMIFDLSSYLDNYSYLIPGCVGEFKAAPNAVVKATTSITDIYGEKALLMSPESWLPDKAFAGEKYFYSRFLSGIDIWDWPTFFAHAKREPVPSYPSSTYPEKSFYMRTRDSEQYPGTNEYYYEGTYMNLVPYNPDATGPEDFQDPVSVEHLGYGEPQEVTVFYYEFKHWDNPDAEKTFEEISPYARTEDAVEIYFSAYPYCKVIWRSGPSVFRLRVQPLDPREPYFKGVVDVTLNVGDAFDSLAGVSVVDVTDASAPQDLTGRIDISGTVDTDTPGRYALSYHVVSDYDLEATVQRTVTVQEGGGTGNGTGDGDLAVDPPETFPEGDDASRVEAGDGGTLTPVLNNRPYIVGMPDGTFQPDKLLTRAEIVVMFDRFYQLEEDYEVLETYNCYSDVTPSAWYADAVNRMTQHGLVKGYLDGTFKPHATITREELAQIIYNQLDIDACYERERVDPMDTYRYNDINGLWSTRAIVGLQSRGLLNDLAQKRFNPTKPVTRAETVVVLNRYFKYDGASGDVIDFKDIPQDSELAPAVAMAHKGNIVYSPFIEDLVQCDDCN